jgi:hypothetical protein
MNRPVVALVAVAGVIGALIALGATSHAEAAASTTGVASTVSQEYPATAARSVGELAARTNWYGMDDGQRGSVQNGTRLGVPLDPARWA